MLSSATFLDSADDLITDLQKESENDIDWFLLKRNGSKYVEYMLLKNTLHIILCIILNIISYILYLLSLNKAKFPSNRNPLVLPLV